MSLTTEEICKIIRENWKFPPKCSKPSICAGWGESDAEVEFREVRCITYNIPSGVIYFFPKETDAINFSKDQISPSEPYGFENLKQDVEEIISPKHVYGKITIPRDKFTDEQFAAIKQSVLQAPCSPGEKAEEKKKNYCAPGDVFSQCKTGTNWKDHQRCRFSEKASRASRCMYFRDFNDTKHCDNHKAQKAEYLSTEDNNG